MSTSRLPRAGRATSSDARARTERDARGRPPSSGTAARESRSRRSSAGAAARESRAPRSDGTQTRQRILEVAAQLYAAQGFAGTTSKEICARAGTNMAAVNYHFGSRDGLYETVLVEAHRQVVSLDELESIAGAGGDPEQRLRAALSRIVSRAALPGAPWAVRVLVREMMSPSQHAPVLVRRAIVPKARVVMSLIAEVLGLSADDPVVQRALAFVLLPCIVMVVAPREVRTQVLPALAATPEALVDDMVRYVSAGLRALREAHAHTGTAPAKRSGGGRDVPPIRTDDGPRTRAGRARPARGPTRGR